MNGPDDIRRSLGRLALVLAVLGLASVVGGIGLVVLGLAGGAALAMGGEVGGGVGLSALAIVAGVLVAAGGVPELLAWYGINRRAAWGRWLGVVLCTVMLAAFPFGTALGAWGLWVLLSSNGLRAFGLQRSWLGDGAALAVGWFFMPDDDDRGWRVDRRGRRHRRGRHGGGGALLLLLLVIGVFAFATCGSCASSFAGGVSSGAGVPSAPASPAPLGMSWGAPATAGAQAGSWLRDHGVLNDAAASGNDSGAPPIVDDGRTGERRLEPARTDGVAPPAGGTGGDGGRAELFGGRAELPDRPNNGDTGAGTGTGQLWTYQDRSGVTHIVDDLEKIPEDRRGTARKQ